MRLEALYTYIENVDEMNEFETLTHIIPKIGSVSGYSQILWQEEVYPKKM